MYCCCCDSQLVKSLLSRFRSEKEQDRLRNEFLRNPNNQFSHTVNKILQNMVYSAVFEIFEFA